MTNPPRLLLSHANPLLRELLDAGVQDNPNAEAAERLAIALGLSSGALAIAAGAESISRAVGAPPPGGLVTSIGTHPFWLAVKWTLLGTVGGLAAVGLVPDGQKSVAKSSLPAKLTVSATSLPRSEAGPPIPVRREQLVDPSPLVAPISAVDGPAHLSSQPGTGSGEQRSARSDVQQRALPSSFGPKVSTALDRGQAQPLALSDADSALALEVRLIDQARASLQARDPRRALGVLEEYDHVARTGTLTREAAFLRIQALAARAERFRAAALIRDYLRKYPADPHVEALQHLSTSLGVDAGQ